MHILNAPFLRELEAKAAAVFNEAGFVEVRTPLFEQYDLFLKTGSPVKQEQMYTFSGRDGHILAVRPDSTTPAARLAGTRLSQRPLKLFYIQPVYRAGKPEINQAGAEWIGEFGKDSELIKLASKLLEALGVKNAHTEIGHAGILKELHLDDEEYLSLLERKNFSSLSDILTTHLGEREAKRVTSLLSLYGKKEVLTEAKSLLPDSNAIGELEKLLEDIDVYIDFGLTGELGYYTGMIFRSYAPGIPGAVVSGGRYDNLMNSFGKEETALGFAVDLNAVLAMGGNI